MIGKMLGHYRVGEQLGRGGMGEVYVADDLNLNRKALEGYIADFLRPIGVDQTVISHMREYGYNPL
jgi:serine/threonine protein kinase